MTTASKLMLSLLMMVLILWLRIAIQSYSFSEPAHTHKCKQSVRITQLPDLALNASVTWVRHRSLVSLGTFRPDDGSLPNPYPEDFVYQFNPNITQ